MVRSTPLRNIPASVRDRLYNKNKEVGGIFEFTIRRYAAERFFYRLGVSEYRDRFVLKGAMLLLVWGKAVSRPTRDIDFSGYGNSSADHVGSIIREICSIPCPEDGMTFDCSNMEFREIRPADEYDGLRVQFKAMLAGARIPMRMDIGFWDVINPPPSDADYPVLLDGPRPRIRIYPRESVIAEKFNALVTHRGRFNRHKDLYDIYGLASHFSFDGGCLANAISATFAQRGTVVSDDLPVGLTPEFYANAIRGALWREYLDHDRLLGAPRNFGQTGELILSFLTEPWDALSRGSKFTGSWLEGGPWLH